MNWNYSREFLLLEFSEATVEETKKDSKVKPLATNDAHMEGDSVDSLEKSPSQP